MHIIEIILNGFKTYAKSTTLAGFDRGFNAITGLNGSGKSNILDAILFCLGISKDLDIIRIKKIQELIYKNGTAGVTKAEVTIVFDNRDKRTSPSQYKKCDTLSFSRVFQQDNTRYFINGHSITQKLYKDALRSVNLNVDVAQFLVAQGCITRLIHLRPPQLSLMIQETAGIATYDAKKLEWANQIKKNEQDIANQEFTLYQDLGPQLKKYESQIQKQLLLAGQIEEGEALTKKMLLYEYFKLSQLMSKEKMNLVLLSNNYKDQKQQLESSEKNLVKAEKDLKEQHELFNINDLRDASFTLKEVNCKIDRLEADLNQIKKNKLASENEIATIQQNMVGHQYKINNFDRILSEQSVQDKTLQKVLEARNIIYDQQLRQNHMPQENQKEQIMMITQRLISDAELAKKKYIQELESYKTYSLKVSTELKNVLKQGENQQERTQGFLVQKAAIEANIKEIQKGLQSNLQLNIDVEQIKYALRDQEEKVDRVKRELVKYQKVLFNKSLISEEFKPKVFGKVFQLIDIKDEKFQKCLEIVAGPKLQNIVVEDHNVGKYILKNKDFSREAIYIIPNKEVRFMCPHQEIRTLIEGVPKYPGDYAHHAIDLVKYDPAVEPSIKYIFGPYIVASSSQYAKRLAFDKLNHQKINVVTLDGDIIDPHGSVSGGFTPESQSIIKLYIESITHQKRLDIETDKLVEIRSKVEQTMSYKDSCMKAQQNLKTQQAELQFVEEKLTGLQGLSVEALSTKLKEEQKRLEGEQAKFQKLVDEADQKLAQHKKDLKAIESGKDTMVYLQEQQQLSKKEIKELEAKIQENNNIRINAEIEHNQTTKELQGCKALIEKEQASINAKIPQIQAMEEKMVKLQKNMLEMEFKVKDLESKQESYEQNTSHLYEEMDRLRVLIPQLEIQIKETKKQLDQTTVVVDDLTKKIQALERKADFLKNEKALVNQIVTPPEYEWVQEFNYEEAQKRVEFIEQEKTRIGKEMNLAVQNTVKDLRTDYDKADALYRKLISDRDNIVQNLNLLEGTRSSEIKKCFMKIRKYFKEIFESLLPGATASLEEWEGRPLDEGVTIAVSINGNPKSLIEMSGGQRSLLALAFILAQLKLCPAPFYILDEIDSALDLAHTENIGQMLAKNFKESQFLLISLKEGMYENANVLFKVAFIDGQSKVERIVLRENKILPRQLTQQEYGQGDDIQSVEGDSDDE